MKDSVAEHMVGYIVTTSGNIFGRMLASSIDTLSICLAYYDKQHSPEVGLESIVCTQNTMLQ